MTKLRKFLYLPEHELRELFPEKYGQFQESLVHDQISFFEFAKTIAQSSYSQYEYTKSLESYISLRDAFHKEFSVKEILQPSLGLGCYTSYISDSDNYAFFFINRRDPKGGADFDQKVFEKWNKLRSITRYREIILQ